MSDTEKRGPGRPRKTVEPVVRNEVIRSDVIRSDDDEARKPTHDARMQYYKVLEYVLLTMKFHCMSGNYQGWYRGLLQFKVMVIAYVQPEKLSGINEKFSRALKLLQQQTNLSRVRSRVAQYGALQTVGELDLVLYEIEEVLHRASKDMMLPTGSGIPGDLDEEQFLRDSGL